MISILLLIACGWTITYQDILDKENYLIIGAVAFGINAVLGLSHYLDDGEYHKFHDFSGWSGFFLVSI